MILEWTVLMYQKGIDGKGLMKAIIRLLFLGYGDGCQLGLPELVRPISKLVYVSIIQNSSL